MLLCRCAAWAALLVMPAAVGAPRGDIVHAVLPIKHAPTASVERTLSAIVGSETPAHPSDLRVPGLEYVALDARKAAILAVGSPEAVAELREIVALIDVPLAQIEVSCRIIKSSRDPDGRLLQTLESEPRIMTQNNMEASVSVGSERATLTAVITPRLNGDNTLTLAGELRMHRGSATGGGGVYCRAVRRVPQGRRTIIAWVPNIGGEDVGSLGLVGVYLESPDKAPGFFLEVSGKVVGAGH